MLSEAVATLELGETRVGHVVADHRPPVGDRNEKRTCVQVAWKGARLYLEGGAAGAGQVDCGAVVHHTFEDGERPYPHGIEEHATALVSAIATALPRWVEQSTQRFGVDAGDAPGRAVDDLMPRIRALLDQDIDDQRTTPLSILREAVRYPTAVLRSAGVAPAERDDHDRAMFPDDDYGLTPASFADFGPQVAEAGIAWGAAKAWTHRRRHGGTA